MMRKILPIVIFEVAFSLANAQKPEMNMIERWGIYEVTLNGPDTGNPFTEIELTAEFKQNGRIFEPQGFYDGNGIFDILSLLKHGRFSKENPFAWQWDCGVSTSDEACKGRLRSQV